MDRLPSPTAWRAGPVNSGVRAHRKVMRWLVTTALGSCILLGCGGQPAPTARATVPPISATSAPATDQDDCPRLQSISAPVGPETLITLCFGQTAPLPAGGSITFAAYDDRRCPSDVKCIWQGEAWGTVTYVAPGADPRRVVLPWNGGAYAWRSHVAVGHHDLELRRLEPRPLTGRAIPASSYSALVAVRVRPNPSIRGEP